MDVHFSFSFIVLIWEDPYKSQSVGVFQLVNYKNFNHHDMCGKAVNIKRAWMDLYKLLKRFFNSELEMS